MGDTALSKVQAAYDRSEARRLKLVAVLRQILKLWDQGDLRPYSDQGTGMLNTLFEKSRALLTEMENERI